MVLKIREGLVLEGLVREDEGRGVWFGVEGVVGEDEKGRVVHGLVFGLCWWGEDEGRSV